MPTGIKLTEQVKKSVVDKYLMRPISISECAKHCGLSSPTVIKILDEYNIVRHKKAKVYNPELYESYFHSIDTQKKAYFLGLIITDGNVFKVSDRSNRQSSISISQSDRDEYILEQFLKEVKSNTGIGRDGRGTSMVAVRSDIMAKDLEQYGVVVNKTLTTILPKLDRSLMPHLIRGILDGDGCIVSHMMGRKHNHSISFCGTHSLMQDISNYISEELGVTKPKVYDYADRHLSEIKWGSIEDCQKIGEWLYNNADTYLTRKYDKFCDFKKHYNLA